MEIRLGNYLDKWDTATVIVCKADTLDVVVYKLSCVLFKMYTIYSHRLLLAVNRYVNVTAQTHGAGHLRYLICFGQVGVEIILSVPLCKA